MKDSQCNNTLYEPGDCLKAHKVSIQARKISKRQVISKGVHRIQICRAFNNVTCIIEKPLKNIVST